MLEIQGVSKRFGSLQANDNISLSLHSGEILALLGENGAGKTTLMNILFGHYSADSGHILVNGKPLPAESTHAALQSGIGMVHQHFTLAQNMTVFENITLGTQSLWQPWSQHRKASAKLLRITKELGLNVDMHAIVSQLSVGEQQRVEILKVLYREASVLILDEPTAVLIPQEVDNLFALLRRMAERGMGVVIITHKLHEVLAVSHRVAVLRRGQLVATAKTCDVTRDDLAEMIVGRQVQRPSSKALQTGSEVLSLREVDCIEPTSRLPLLKQVTIAVHQKEIVGLAGVSGNGQTQVASVISGLTAADTGGLYVNGQRVKRPTPARVAKLGVARIPEDRHASGIVGDMSIWENLLLEDIGQAPCWRAGFMNKHAARERAEQLVSQFDIRCSNIEMPAKLLSGGNIQKLILARNLMLKPHFILANQPARGLDEGAIAFVHSSLLEARENGAGVLLISEDLDELLRLCDTLHVISEGEVSKAFSPEGVSARDIGRLMAGDINQVPTQSAPNQRADNYRGAGHAL